MSNLRIACLSRFASWVPADIVGLLDPRRGEALPPLRSEIFGVGRFEQHGQSLAATHLARRLSFGQRCFYPRLQSNIRTLRRARDYISRQALLGQDSGPAADWLLDNFHLIEDQVREVHAGLPARYFGALPVLQNPPLMGLPRIYGVAWAFVAHTDSAFDATLLLHYLNAYQGVRELSQGELWALPTTLRVVLIENLRRLADRIASHQAAREIAVLMAAHSASLTVAGVSAMRQLMARRGVGEVFVVQLMGLLPTQLGTGANSIDLSLRNWLAKEVPNVGACLSQQHVEEAADQLSIGNAVTALRTIGSADWPGIVAQTSRVMRVMLRSPVFAAEDEATRNKTLHAIERLSAASQKVESEVASILLAAIAGAVGPAALAGYWLRGEGRSEFERGLGIRRLLPQAWRQQLRLSSTHAYFGTLLLGTLMLLGQLGDLVRLPGAGWGRGAAWVSTLLLMALPASEVVVALVNRLVSEATPPVHLSRLQLAEGIPLPARTLVVVPALLTHVPGIDALVHRLLLHHLANVEAHVQFGLLSDWGDAHAAQLPGDEALLAHAVQALQALNASHPSAAGQPPRFLLLHRARSHSATQGRWLGWERKRGKLEQLVAALCSGALGPFLDLGPLSQLAPGTCHLLTLDSDTVLPPGRLRALVGVAEHPQNRPLLAPDGRRVVSGYGILQPRVAAPLPAQGGVTAWQWMLSSQGGLDPYAAVCSDIYQDVFDEGSYTGKGLLHVQTLHAVLGGRLPAEQILSHDLLEGALARCAVVSDVTLLESDPSHSDVAAARLHRWTRGDWQLLPFLLDCGRWRLGAVNRWKLFDNLRRSLVAPACLALVAMAMAGIGLPLATTLSLTLSAYAGGPLLGALAGAIPLRRSLLNARFVRAAGADLARTLITASWHLAMLPQHALLMLDAVVRTLYRVCVSRRQLLAWTTADASQAALGAGLGATLRRHWREPAWASLLLLGLWLQGPVPGALVLGTLALWACAPLLAWLANNPWVCLPRKRISRADEAFLHGVARDTWRYFERCVDADNHHLPPDNLQITPLEVMAHRTSPSNIGLYLLSAASARQFGWIGTQELLERLRATLDTLGRMERHRGHFLNWYDTQTLRPLLPCYVSTVDSGNLSIHLLAVAQACRALATLPHDPAPACKARRHSLERLQALRAPPPGRESKGHSRREREEWHWLRADHMAMRRSARRDRQVAGSAGDAQASAELRALAKTMERLAWASDFRYLYHPRRQLLHIGYRVQEQQLDNGFYDLLASESNLTSLLAIAKGDVPVHHWWALGRPFFVSGRHAVLRSWSGSMFEYLMPSLVMAVPPCSALQEANRSALREQIAFARTQGHPWGMSESAHAGRDQTLTYQYAPQGVPRLAMRRTPQAERVVAPYATALASMMDVRAACCNLRSLAALGARGRYGFVDALDFSPARQIHGGRQVAVNTYMAHHQGMTIVALSNALLGGVAQRWGGGHPRIEAMHPLLHERAPRDLPGPPPLPFQPLKAMSPRATEPVCPCVPGAQTLEPTQLMSNGRYTVTLRPNGAGWSRLGQQGIGRWRDDALRDAHGSFLYLRRCPNGVPVSLTSHPAPDPQAVYRCHLGVDRVSFDAHWPDLKARTTVWVSPEDDIELRRVVLSNTGSSALELELMSAFDITLASHDADEAHPAFSGLFVTARWDSAHQALHFARTPRLHTERPLCAAHFIANAQCELLGLRIQTDRQRWLGRNRPPSHPLAELYAAPAVSGPLVTGLDPVAAMALVVRLAPGAHACIVFGTAASHEEATLSAVVEKHRQSSHVERSSTMSAALANLSGGGLYLHPEYQPALRALTTALVQILPRPRDQGEFAQVPTQVPSIDRRLLWPLGISGDRPILLLHVGPDRGLTLLRLLALLLRVWSRAGVACDLVVLSRENHSYHMPLQQACAQLNEQHQARLGQQFGPAVAGLHLLRHDNLAAQQLGALLALARVQLHADAQPLPHQVKAWCERHQTSPMRPWPGDAPVTVQVHLHPGHTTLSKGGFEPESGAFVFEVGHGQRTERPWSNVLANPDFGCLVTESGGGNTWALNSRLNQLTAWTNDPVADTPGEWWLLQDRRSGVVWSLTPSAWGDDSTLSRVEHAQGLTTMSQRRGTLSTTLSWCVDPDCAVKQLRVRLHNHGGRKAHLRLVGMLEWVLGQQRADRATLHSMACRTAPPGGPMWALLCTQAGVAGGFGGGTAFFCEASNGPDRNSDGLDWTTDRSAFFDAQGRLALPSRLGQREGGGLDPCAAISRLITLRPGASAEWVVLIGHAADQDGARALAHRAAAQSASERERRCLARWDALLGATQVRTPDPLFDVLVNRWLLYQTVSSRLWAKAGFYQAGGAMGYRDQLQDAMALVWAAPQLLRAQIVLCASRQFEAGDVQHWWHAPDGAGVRAHFSDDLLWLPFACTHYLRQTDDLVLLDQQVHFLEGRTVPDEVEDVYESPRRSTVMASVYEHAARAVDRSLRVGEHGLPLMGGGDWNDGMNRVGHQGRGESVWLAWFLCAIVADWLPLARQRADTQRADRWEAARAAWMRALADEAWDGQWYRRAFFDDGSVLGSSTRSEAQIDLIAQAWSVLADADTGALGQSRQRQAMIAVTDRLVDSTHGLLQLLTPPLAMSMPSPGYIQAYPPGVRENGGQYTHAAVWALMAHARLARLAPADQAAQDLPYRDFTWLSPAHRAEHPRWGRVYGLEPYVVAADVYSQPPYTGRGGWSWFTGAAGWLHRAAIESILGLHWEAEVLCLIPCLPMAWSRVELRLARDGRRMRFVLVRGSAEQALAVCQDPQARLLGTGEMLRWIDLAPYSCFAMALPGRAEAEVA